MWTEQLSDVGDRLGFLEATVEYALRRKDLREQFLDYLAGIMQEAAKDK